MFKHHRFFRKTRIIEFFVVGFLLGVLEDIFVVWLVTGQPITFHIILIISLITIPFAFLNEYITDHPFFWSFLFPKKIKEKLLTPRYEKKMRYIEFFVVGVVFGLCENLIALTLATDAQIDFSTVLIAGAAALPFAYFSEMVVDKPGFWKKYFPA